MIEQQNYYQGKLKYEIDSWDLNELMHQSAKLKVIDARSKKAFDNEHIPGSINLPHREMSVKTTDRFDKETLYVTYCDGIGCNASTKGALNMTKLGFKVKELIGGLDWWKREGYETNGEKSRKENDLRCGC
jgi:rhodanese-related sulfurtransferase